VTQGLESTELDSLPRRAWH